MAPIGTRPAEERRNREQETKLWVNGAGMTRIQPIVMRYPRHHRPIAESDQRMNY